MTTERERWLPFFDVSGPRYSIVITCYNQEWVIRPAVDSALSQRTSSKEVIVVDDGSHDGSVDVLKEFGSRIRVLALSDNRGAAEARNLGAAVACGDYLIFLDGDDLLSPWALDVYDELIPSRKPAAVVGRARWFEGDVPLILPHDEPRRVAFAEHESLMAVDRAFGLSVGAFVISHGAFHKIGGWTPSIFHLDGQDLYAKLGYSGKAVVVHSPCTMLYRIHDSNSIHSVASFIRSAYVILSRERAGIYPGGKSRRFERQARHGGTVMFCIKRGLRTGLIRESLRLAMRGWRMILIAALRKFVITIKGRRPVQTHRLDIASACASKSALAQSIIDYC